MANCLKCGAQLPTFSFGEASPYCKECQAETPRPPKPGIRDLLGSAGVEVSPWLNATNALVVINVLVFLAMVATGVSWIEPSNKDLLRWGADYGPNTFSGQYWRLITPSFVHIGILHLLLNMWCLWSLGRLLERLVGGFTLLGVYLVTGAGATLLSLAWDPMRISAGASGAIFGFAGVLIAVFYRGDLGLAPENGRRLLGYVVQFSLINLIYGLRSNVNNMAHLGGLATGLLAGLFLARTFSVPQEEREAQRRTVLGLTSLAVALLFVYVVHSKSYVVELHKGQVLLEQGNPNAAIEPLKKYTAARPKHAFGHAMLGSAYQNSQQYDQAAREYEQSLRLEPNYTFVQINLGKVYLQLDKPTQAVPLLKAGLSKVDADADTYYWYAEALLATGQFADAEQAARQASRMEPQDKDAQELLRQILDFESKVASKSKK